MPTIVFQEYTLPYDQLHSHSDKSTLKRSEHMKSATNKYFIRVRNGKSKRTCLNVDPAFHYIVGNVVEDGEPPNMIRHMGCSPVGTASTEGL